jgi:transcriptional regulator with XRE-family HTH domain
VLLRSDFGSISTLYCEDEEPVDKAEWQAFGEWVESLRKRSGLQVRELAERAEVSAQWLQELRHGGRAIYGTWRLPNPKDEALARLARALNVPVEEMFARAGRDGVPPGADETDTSAGAAEGDDAERATVRLRELEKRVARHEQELAELRELVQQRQQRAGRADAR